MLKYAKRKHRIINVVQLKATDVLYEKMYTYNHEAKDILKILIEGVKEQNKNSPALKALYQLMKQADDVVIDCAHKLAPFQSPRLNAIDVRNKIEHRFVMRAPKAMSSVEEWAAITGAEKLKHERSSKKQKDIEPPTPSLHDFEDEEDSLQDEINTQRSLN